MRASTRGGISAVRLAVTLSVGLLLAASAILTWVYWPQGDCGWGMSPVTAAGIALCW